MLSRVPTGVAEQQQGCAPLAISLGWSYMASGGRASASPAPRRADSAEQVDTLVSLVGRLSAGVIPTRVKADSFRGFQTGASQIPWRRTGGSPCGQGLHFVRTMMQPSFGP